MNCCRTSQREPPSNSVVPKLSTSLPDVSKIYDSHSYITFEMTFWLTALTLDGDESCRNWIDQLSPSSVDTFYWLEWQHNNVSRLTSTFRRRPSSWIADNWAVSGNESLLCGCLVEQVHPTQTCFCSCHLIDFENCRMNPGLRHCMRFARFEPYRKLNPLCLCAPDEECDGVVRTELWCGVDSGFSSSEKIIDGRTYYNCSLIASADLLLNDMISPSLFDNMSHSAFVVASLSEERDYSNTYMIPLTPVASSNNNASMRLFLNLCSDSVCKLISADDMFAYDVSNAEIPSSRFHIKEAHQSKTDLTLTETETGMIDWNDLVRRGLAMPQENPWTSIVIPEENQPRVMPQEERYDSIIADTDTASEVTTELEEILSDIERASQSAVVSPMDTSSNERNNVTTMTKSSKRSCFSCIL